jgi:hypothetical protein
MIHVFSILTTPTPTVTNYKIIFKIIGVLIYLYKNVYTYLQLKT